MTVSLVKNVPTEGTLTLALSGASTAVLNFIRPFMFAADQARIDDAARFAAEFGAATRGRLPEITVTVTTATYELVTFDDGDACFMLRDERPSDSSSVTLTYDRIDAIDETPAQWLGRMLTAEYGVSASDGPNADNYTLSTWFSTEDNENFETNDREETTIRFGGYDLTVAMVRQAARIARIEGAQYGLTSR